jgi:hypothetical protein
VGRQSDEEGKMREETGSLYRQHMTNVKVANWWEYQQKISKDLWEWNMMERCGRHIIAAH